MSDPTEPLEFAVYMPELIPEKYQQWMAANSPENPYGKCAEVTEQMQQAFPELTRVRGYFYDPHIGPRAHWWLILDGLVIDPTVGQFPSHGVGVYEPWEADAPEPIGRCLNCGELCYERDGSDAHQICSPECYAAFAAELNSPR